MQLKLETEIISFQLFNTALNVDMKMLFSCKTKQLLQQSLSERKQTVEFSFTHGIE